MAIIKAVSSHAAIETVINYVCQKEKTEYKLMSGIGCSPESAIDEMQATKLLYRKTGGRTYKHFVQSFAPEEKITPELAHELAVEFAHSCPLFQGFEVLAVTHQDRDHIHTHFVVNSVSYEDGHKFQMKSTELQDMKDLSDALCLKYGLSICEKGYSFDGREREDTTAYAERCISFLICVIIVAGILAGNVYLIRKLVTAFKKQWKRLTVQRKAVLISLTAAALLVGVMLAERIDLNVVSWWIVLVGGMDGIYYRANKRI